MNTEMTENMATVFYDGDCAICTRGARRFGPLLRARGFKVLPLQTPGVPERLGVTPEKLFAEMHLAMPDGRVFAGADALLQISRHYWWAWPVYLVSFLPGVKPLTRVAYRWFARNRYCISGACGLKPPRHHGSTSFFDMP